MRAAAADGPTVAVDFVGSRETLALCLETLGKPVVAAINGGSHVAPAFAGDTVYAWSEVLDRAEIPGHSDSVGALRLRTGQATAKSQNLQRGPVVACQVLVSKALPMLDQVVSRRPACSRRYGRRTGRRMRFGPSR